MTHTRYPFVATAQLMAGAALLFCLWTALPTRYLPVDILGSAVGGLLVMGGLGLAIGRPWGRKLGIVAAAVTTLLGTVAIVALAFGIGELAGLYGPVGMGGATIMGLVAALLFAYFVALPALGLAVLLGRDPKADA